MTVSLWVHHGPPSSTCHTDLGALKLLLLSLCWIRATRNMVSYLPAQTFPATIPAPRHGQLFQSRCPSRLRCSHLSGSSVTYLPLAMGHNESCGEEGCSAGIPLAILQTIFSPMPMRFPSFNSHPE